jgi:hypothetical protein
MQNPRESLSVGAMLIIHEDLIAQLYETYAQKFPEKAEFWLSLSREEVTHANALCSVNPRAMKKRAVNTKIILASLEYLRLLLSGAQRNISLNMALYTALQVEESIIEHGFLKSDEGGDEQTRRVLAKLTRETRSHASRIRTEREQLSQQGAHQPVGPN